jgi:hypothetical protein
MRVIYFIVRAIAYLFIGIWGAISLIFYYSFMHLKKAFLRSKFYEQRILLALAIILVQATFVIGIPIAASFVFPTPVAHINMKTEKLVWGTQPNWDWMALIAPMCLTFIPFGCALYFTNHWDGDAHWIEGEVHPDDLEWGAKIEPKKPKTEIDENDTDYRDSIRELNRDLDEKRNFENRLRT